MPTDLYQHGKDTEKGFKVIEKSPIHRRPPVSFSYGKIPGKDRKYRFAGILEKRNQPCIKKDSKPDAGWNYTGLRRKYNSLSDG